VPTAIGHLHLLWWWALEYTRDGDLSGFDDEEVAIACVWEGEPAALRAALIGAGFLDACGAIHDWDDYAGKLLDQRKANAEKQARWRNRNRLSSIEADNRDVTVTEPSRTAATVPNPTVPNPTRPTPTTPVERRAPDADAPDALPAPVEAAIVPSKRRVAVHESADQGRQRDLHWEALEAIFGPCRTRAERDSRNAANTQFKEAGVDPADLHRAARNWPNVMSDAVLTPHGLAKHLGMLLEGPQVNGRSRGVTVGLHQQGTQRTALRPSSDDELAAALRGRR
jgi:hypothetical protein